MISALIRRFTSTPRGEVGAAQQHHLPDDVAGFTGESSEIRARAVCVTFPGASSIGPLSFEVRAGESVLLLGPSGCGKSTILRALSGAIPSTIHASISGDIELCGRSVGLSDPASIARDLGVVAQDPWASVCLPIVGDDVAFALENLAVPAGLIGAQVERVAGETGIEHLLDAPVAQLSGGQLQRVALAGALVARPRALLLDEPTSMLDHAGVTQVVKALGRMAVGGSESPSVIMVEHRLDELAELSGSVDGFRLPNRWIVLDVDGSVLWDGSPDFVSNDVARQLWRHGCWLPLELELQGRFGHSGGLESPEILRALDACGRVVDGGALGGGALGGGRVGAAPGATCGAVGDAQLTAHELSVVPRALKGWGESTPAPAQPLLSGVTFTVHAGELVALVGANGSGKTTLMRALAGVDQPAHGTVTAGSVGLVFQNPEHQFMTSTVLEEMLYNLPSTMTGQAAELLTEFGLTGLDTRSPFSLSGGQKRRLSLAAMMMHSPEFLCADEPTYGLDRLASNSVMRALQTYSESGHGVLFSSHDLRTIATYASRVIVLANGTVHADVDVLELIRNPRLLAAAQLYAPHIVQWFAQNCATPQELNLKLQRLNDSPGSDATHQQPTPVPEQSGTGVGPAQLGRPAQPGSITEAPTKASRTGEPADSSERKTNNDGPALRELL